MTNPHTQTVAAVLELLAYHPAVAFAWKANAGAMTVGHRTVRFGFAGQPDIVGMLKGGRFLAIEIKTGKGQLTKDQRSFLTKVRIAGGVAGVCHSVDEAALMLEMLPEATRRPRSHDRPKAATQHTPAHDRATTASTEPLRGVEILNREALFTILSGGIQLRKPLDKA